ncbi:hypothetical protein DJ018_05755 [Phenylobacterium deserti]|uniref:Uncharacterized protein n=2 Tax=Phenylobacterium deserti TaxID=1914756 RepID=A0A328AV52_9CAUL|nr:hypothetical protein DJ018_05755 [Phenylobacterium deserti]
MGALVLGVLGAASAGAQQAPVQSDAIGAILDAPPRSTIAPEEPDTAAAPPEPTPAPIVAAPPQRPTGPPQATRPVFIEETGRTPDRPPTVESLAYDSRIRASFASAQSFQGALDGAWTLSAQGEGDLYALKLVDRGDGVVEGAWRDLRRKGALNGSGFVDSAERTSADVVLRFTDMGGAPATLTLEPAAVGWSGNLETGGERRQVSLRRAPTP